jgi:hypothetical protein
MLVWVMIISFFATILHGWLPYSSHFSAWVPASVFFLTLAILGILNRAEGWDRVPKQHDDTMLARLGNVLYWAGCILAAVPLGYAAWVIISGGGIQIPIRSDDLWFFAIFAVLGAIPWAIGWACRYVLSGQTS